jgi:hypothetical protein
MFMSSDLSLQCNRQIQESLGGHSAYVSDGTNKVEARISGPAFAAFRWDMFASFRAARLAFGGSLRVHHFLGDKLTYIDLMLRWRCRRSDQPHSSIVGSIIIITSYRKETTVDKTAFVLIIEDFKVAGSFIDVMVQAKCELYCGIAV